MAAETILIPVAKQILGKASDLALEQLGLLWNFRPELQKLKDTVSTIQAVLGDAEEKQVRNRQVKDWLEKLSDVMYDADDLLDDLATEACRKALLATTTTCWSLVCFLFSSLPKQLAYDLKMAHAIKAIREKLDLISKDKETLHLEVHTTEAEAIPSRETDSCPPTIVVGREDDKQNIVQLLLNSNHEATISVEAIVGMGGLGKTTLAQLIFDDDQVHDHFDMKAWVYVSQSFDVKVILRKILRSIDCQTEADSELDYLQAKFRENIQGKRFLFVLDDVWEETNQSWETMGKYLTTGSLGSKVLVTTRSTKVAEVSGVALKSKTRTGVVEPYHLKGLSEEESWNLLVKKAPPRRVLRDPEVQEIGKQILRKCDGVPLAVSAIASVLVDSRDPKTEWPSFLQKGLLSIMKVGEEDPIMSVLQLSFNHLPSYMKSCFAYCKLFPKGFEFSIQMLVQFWVIHKYIETEDKGFDCFKTLWGRSFFQEVVMDDLGNMSTCRMHDLMHDLADLSGGEKIMRSSSSTCFRNISSTTRHLAITGDLNDDSREDYYDSSGLGNPHKVRTLICLKILSKKEFEQILQNFLRLRVLVIIEGPNSYYDGPFLDASLILNYVHKLKHLRYLGLSCYEWETVPNSIATLVNMQVLKLVDVWSLKELPRDMKTLVNLKHLELDSERVKLTHIPEGIGEMKVLQTLSIFVVGKRVGAGLDELKGLNALGGKLTIKGLAYADTLRGVYVLKEKLYLHSLVLDWGRDGDRDVDDVTLLSTHDDEILEMLRPHSNLKKLMIYGRGVYEGVKLPNWLSGLTNLVEFSLKDCKLCEYLPQLHQMSSLKKLTIDNCPQLKGIDRDGYHCDSSMEKSTTEEEDDEWPQFHSLSHLCIKGCPMLTRLPTFPTVEGELRLERVSLAPFARTMKMKMRRGGGGGIDYLERYAYDDTNIHPLLSSATSSSTSSSALVHPLSKLTEFTLSHIDDDLESLSHHDFKNCLISIMNLSIEHCGRGVKLPGSLCSSIYLTDISLFDCKMVEYLPPLHELPSLKVLSIIECPNLKGCWWKKRQGNNKHHKNSGYHDYYNLDSSMEEEEVLKEGEEVEEEWPHFPSLSYLNIRYCPKLTRVPLFPTLEGGLLLEKTSAQALVRTMKMKAVVIVDVHHLDSQQHSAITTTSTASPSSFSLRTALISPLSKLTEIILDGISDLESLPEEGLCNLTSLQEFVIWNCPRLASLPPAMRHLTSLPSLRINNCEKLTERCKEKDWPNISHIPYILLDYKELQNLGRG